MGNSVEHLMHVICVPFRIRAKGNAPVYLQSTADILKKSKWKAIGDDHRLTGAPDATWSALQKYQARAYFHPFVQRFLYDTDRVRHFAREDVKSLEVDFYIEEHETTTKRTFYLEVKRCELVLFQPDIGTLLLEASPTESFLLKDTQLLLDSLRRLYPPYLDQDRRDPGFWQSGHCPGEVRLLDDRRATIGAPGVYFGKSRPGESEAPDFFAQYAKAFGKRTNGLPVHFPLAAHWHALLDPFNTDSAGQCELSVHQFGDDRAPTMTYLAVTNPRDISDGDWMRLCFSDAPGDSTLPYAKRFMQDFEKTYCYDRYWYEGEAEDSSYSPSRILNCGQSFTYVGAAKDTYFFVNQKNGAPPTFRDIYVTMGLIAHFQRAALLAASERLTELVRRNKTGDEIIIPDRNEVREFYNHFVEFTQNFWFDEISPQVQGQELFDMWRKHLRIQELYDEVHQELKDLVAYAELRAADKLNQTVSYFGFAAIVLAVISAIAGIFGLSDVGTKHLENWMTFAPWWPKALLWPAPSDITSISIPLLLVSVLTFVVLILVMGFKRWKTRSETS